MIPLLVHIDAPELLAALGATLVMLLGSLALTIALGLPLGVVLFLTARGELLDQPLVHGALSFAVNVLRSLPFVILMILMIPLTVSLVGTSLGVEGAIPPLVAGAAPFFARLVESALRAVDRGVIEATNAMGAAPWRIVVDALLPEALPGLVAGATVTAVALVSYTAMAGVVGAGGLGDLAVRFGYQRFQTDVMIVTVLALLVLVQLIQVLGDRISARLSRS